MKVAYVHIPKTGGGSIKHWWATNVSLRHDMITSGHQNLEEILRTTEQSIDTSFTLVRNSWGRLISAYVFAENKIKKKLSKYPNDPNWSESFSKYRSGIIPWLEWMQSHDHINVRCQVRYSEGVQHIIRGHSADAWQRFLNVLGVTLRPSRTHRVLDYDPSVYMSREYVDWVADHYQDEIKEFGFQPEIRS